MRDWIWIDRYYRELLGDIYHQPADDGHTAWAKEIIDKWVPLLDQCESVLDVGAGVGFCQALFAKHRVNNYVGVAIGEDVLVAKAVENNVVEMDFNFLNFPNDSFDLVFSRHSLEHSPFPLLSLMEWHRVGKKFLCVILPTPKYWLWGGLNHYGMMSASQARFLMRRAGWNPIWEDHTEQEFRFMCEKVDRVSKLDDSNEEYEREE